MRPAIALYGLMIPPRFGDGGKSVVKKSCDGGKNVRNEARAAEFWIPLSWKSPLVRFAISGNASHQ
jgi:hypothetical protein